MRLSFTVIIIGILIELVAVIGCALAREGSSCSGWLFVSVFGLGFTILGVFLSCRRT